MTIYGSDVLNHSQTAEYLGCSANTLTARYRDWGLEAHKMGGINYWYKSDLEKFILKRRKAREEAIDPRHAPRVAIGRGYVAGGGS
jgi:hypothetical protein